jgi:ketosteroid isomerase-like protein
MDTTSHPEVPAFFDRYAEALAGGDLPGIAACYVVPALVVGDSVAVPVAEPAEVEAAFAGAAEAYRAQGLVGIRPELGAVEPLTSALTLVEVCWAYLDETGAARQRTSYRYLLRRSDTGQLGIQVVVDTTSQT